MTVLARTLLWAFYLTRRALRFTGWNPVTKWLTGQMCFTPRILHGKGRLD